MKNIVKYLGLAILVIMMLVILAGCGQDTIVATMTETNETIGDCEVRVEILFDGDAISTIKIAMNFSKENYANYIVTGGEELGLNFEQEGNSVYTELTAQEYKEAYGQDFSVMSKEEIIQQLEAEGYTIVEK